MNKKKWIVFSGLLWFATGIMLLYKGERLLVEASSREDSLCFHFKETFGSPQQTATVFLAFAMFIGFMKSRIVLSKTVNRIVSHIHSLASPIRFQSVYPRSYWILISCMVALGMLFRFLPVPIDVRGAIDAAIGFALMNGAMLYFRAARAKEPLSHL